MRLPYPRVKRVQCSTRKTGHFRASALLNRDSQHLTDLFRGHSRCRSCSLGCNNSGCVVSWYLKSWKLYHPNVSRIWDARNPRMTLSCCRASGSRLTEVYGFLSLFCQPPAPPHGTAKNMRKHNDTCTCTHSTALQLIYSRHNGASATLLCSLSEVVSWWHLVHAVYVHGSAAHPSAVDSPSEFHPPVNRRRCVPFTWALWFSTCPLPCTPCSPATLLLQRVET